MIILGLEPGSELNRTLNQYSNQKELLKRKLDDFIAFKIKHPYNGKSQGVSGGYGSSDRVFKPDGIFAKEAKNVAHAHLTHNISIVYRIDRVANTITLFGLYTHDEIGTGSPANVNRQRSAGSRWNQMDFDLGQGIDSDEFMAQYATAKEKPERPGSFTAGDSGKVDYTPAQRPTPVAVQHAQKVHQQIKDPFNAAVEIADSHWEDRNFKNRMYGAKNLGDRLGLINGEVQYLAKIAQRHKLHSNQLSYAKSLQDLYNYLVSTQRKKTYESVMDGLLKELK